MRHIKIILLAFLASVAPPFFPIVASAADATNAPAPLLPGPNDGRIAYMTARLLEEFHYSQQPLDVEMSKKFFDGYVEALDPRRENFLQSDLAEFAHYRTNLDAYTIGGRRQADLTPAFDIFERLLQRMQEHTDFVDKVLKENKFTFTTDERIAIDRRHAPYAKNLAEAQQLWLQRVRYEYLQEKLDREAQPPATNLVMTLTNQAATLSATNNSTNDIAGTIAHHYDWILHTISKWDGADILQAYLNALAHAYDPHTDYFPPENAEDFSIGMSLSLVGIGAQLGEDYGYCTISSLVPGGPAAKSKLLNEKDQIVAVAQSNSLPVNVVDMELTKVVQMIRGTKGTQVQLTIIPAEDHTARRVVTLVRDEIKLEDEEAKAQLVEMPDARGGTNRIGVIELPSFYGTVNMPGEIAHSPKSCTEDVARLIKKLEQEKVQGIILDMRGNPGGLLNEAVDLTGLFIKSGPVVLARDPEGKVTVLSDTDNNQLYSGPLVVMINRFSASAAEICAAALQDYGRALVVGDTSTHGKGTVQKPTPLRPFVWPATASATNDPGTLKITINKFYRVSGASTQLKGVASDIILPDILNASTEIGETSLENPLPWDTIPSADYDKLNLVQPYLAHLRKYSGARTATNQDFTYIRQDIDELKKLQADKTITLNEREALKERQTNQARQKARDDERAARKAPDEKIYDLTLENIGQPELPAPESMLLTNSVTYNFTNSFDSNFTNFFGTNTAAATTGQKSEVKPRLTDPTLNETENILEDYISLLPSKQTLIADH
jgi:carboxyl-terminal processing protease